MRRNPDGAPTDDGRVPVARVLGPRGIGGEVKVLADPALLERLGKPRTVIAETGENGRIRLDIEAVMRYGRSTVLKMSGIDDREAASTLTGALLMIEKEEIPPLEGNRYYRFEFVGMEAVDPDGWTIGTVVRVDEYPAQDVIVIDAGGSEIWVPAVGEFIVRVDPGNRRIVIARSGEFPLHAGREGK